MQLTDNEKRDVIKCLEAGIPLPDKYRFLLFKDDREVELVWNGKTNEVTNTVLPFQVIEQIDEPRSDAKFGNQNSLFDASGRQITGWTNKLIWGDNKLILSSLKNGPLRKEIEAQGGLKLIYIDPPFDVGADFSMSINVGDGDNEESFTKKPSVIEEIAYRDTWGKGADSFISMIYERLRLMHDLLAEDGSIYVHCDWRLSGHVRLVLDEVFGKDNFRNEIVWAYTGPGSPGMRQFNRKHDNIFWYSKSDHWMFNGDEVRVPSEVHAGGFGSGMDNSESSDYENKGKIPEDWWEFAVAARLRIDGTQRTGYPTEKPNKFLERIIKTSSKEGDLIADFFAGQVVFLYNAEILGRKWIGSDLGRFGIHTSRKRLIGVQRDLKKESKNFRAFEILNIGRYERENFVKTNNDLREEEKKRC